MFLQLYYIPERMRSALVLQSLAFGLREGFKNCKFSVDDIAHEEHCSNRSHII